MALGDSYASIVDLRSRLNITDTTDDGRLTAALAAASRGIERTCQRQFNSAGGVSARMYRPNSQYEAKVDDFSTSVGLIVKTDEGDDGQYDTAWQAFDYELWPLNGIQDGETGWPYWRIRAVESKWFNIWSRRAFLQVTANWGWAAVPSVITESTLIVATEIFKLKDAPFGVAGFGDYGAVRVRENPMVCAMVKPYVREPVLVG
jgi:hypothetical protein